jgi:hypothetical protein
MPFHVGWFNCRGEPLLIGLDDATGSFVYMHGRMILLRIVASAVDLRLLIELLATLSRDTERMMY